MLRVDAFKNEILELLERDRPQFVGAEQTDEFEKEITGLIEEIEDLARRASGERRSKD